MNSLWYCLSYREVLRYERNSAALSKDHITDYMQKETSVKFMADNVDHNLCTLNGENKFHGMEMIVSITGGNFATRKVERSIVSEKEILNMSSVNIVPYKGKSSQVTNTNFQLIHLNKTVPLWPGFMQLIHNVDGKNEHKKDNIFFAKN